jgi:peptidoglycan/xylan/chitin deacetylase (PgdA/CDA1 family)
MITDFLHATSRGCLSAAARLSYVTGVTRVMDWLQGERGCCLMFHRTARHDDWADQPDRGFYLDVEFLDSLLAKLRRSGWTVLSISEALEALERGSSGRFVNFSIDDVYRDAIELAVPLFHSHDAPVTLFVTTGIPDGTVPLWGPGLESILRERDRVVVPDLDHAAIAIPNHRRKHALFARLHARWERDEPTARYRDFCAVNGYSPDELRARHTTDWDMLRSAAAVPGVEIASHTILHRRISRLPYTDALQELAGSRSRLEEQLGREIRHLAFPYGQPDDCGERDFQLARQAGYASVAVTVRGIVKAQGSAPFVLPRNSLNGEDRHMAAVTAHLAGLSGMLEQPARDGEPAVVETIDRTLRRPVEPV